MQAPNFIVEESSSSKAKCRACNNVIYISDIRIRVPPAQLYHLRCFVPEYPTRINPRYVHKILYHEENSLVFDEWLDRWNEQFRAVTTETLSPYFRRLPQRQKINNRGLLEVFKFLAAVEVVQTGLTSREWYSVATHTEVWNDLIELRYPDFDFQTQRLPHPKFSYIFLEKATCTGCHQVLSDSQVAYLSPFTNRPVCTQCSLSLNYSVTTVSDYMITAGVSKKYIEDVKIPMFTFSGKKIIFSSVANEAMTQFRDNRRRELNELLKTRPHSFNKEDLEYVQNMNLSQNTYMAPFLMTANGEQGDLMDMLKFIFKSCARTGITGRQLLLRNEKRHKRRRNSSVDLEDEVAESQ